MSNVVFRDESVGSDDGLVLPAADRHFVLGCGRPSGLVAQTASMTASTRYLAMRQTGGGDRAEDP